MCTCPNIIKKYMYCFFVLLCSIFLCSMLPACSTISTSPNSTSNSQGTPTPKMNEQVSEFLREHNLTLADKSGWVPSQILDYTDRTDGKLDNFDDEINAYIIYIDDDKIGLNEVIWISDMQEESGFKIVDPSPEVIQCPIAQDVEVWVLTEMVHIKIPLEDLKSYVEKFDYALWNVEVKEGKVTALMERYVP